MDYRFKILEAYNYDGDSFDLHLDLGFSLSFFRKCRIYGIDTPELRGGTDKSKAAGYLARDRAREYVANGMADPDVEVVFESTGYAGKFGRPLGDIVFEVDAGECIYTTRLSESLLAERLAVRYHGQAKSEIQAEHDANIAHLEEKGLI